MLSYRWHWVEREPNCDGKFHLKCITRLFFFIFVSEIFRVRVISFLVSVLVNVVCDFSRFAAIKSWWVATDLFKSFFLWSCLVFFFWKVSADASSPLDFSLQGFCSSLWAIHEVWHHVPCSSAFKIKSNSSQIFQEIIEFAFVLGKLDVFLEVLLAQSLVTNCYRWRRQRCLFICRRKGRSGVSARPAHLCPPPVRLRGGGGRAVCLNSRRGGCFWLQLHNGRKAVGESGMAGSEEPEDLTSRDLLLVTLLRAPDSGQ